MWARRQALRRLGLFVWLLVAREASHDLPGMCWADVQSALGRGAPRDFLRSLLALPPSERHPAVTEHLPQLQQQGEAFLLECLTEVAAMQEPENLAGLLSGQLGSLNLTAQWRPEAAEVASRLWRASNRSRMAALRLLQSWEVREEDAEEALLALGREALGSQVWEHQALYLQSFPNLGRRLNVTAQKVIDDLCSAGQNKLAKAMTEKCLSGHEKKKVLGRLRLARIKAAAVSEGGEIDGIVAVGRNPKLQAVLIRELWKAGKRGLAEERQKAWKLNLKDLKKSGLKRAHQRLGRFQNLPSSVKLHMVSLQDLEDLTRRMRWWKVVGLDTEASNSKGLSLLQVATWKDVYLLDMTRKSPEMTRFVERLLAAPNISKLAFGGSEHGDLCRLSGLNQIPRYHDLQQLAGQKLKLGSHSGQLGLSRLAEEVVGKPLNKEMRASDWAHRPLLHWQKVYAALDAWILLEIWKCLGKPKLP